MTEMYDYHIRVECDDHTPLDETRQFPDIKSAWDAVIAVTAEHRDCIVSATVLGPEV